MCDGVTVFAPNEKLRADPNAFRFSDVKKTSTRLRSAVKACRLGRTATGKYASFRKLRVKRQMPSDTPKT